MNTSTAQERASDRLHTLRARGRLARVGLSSASIQRFLSEVVEDDLHVKTILSLANATLGVLHAASLCIHVIGRAYGWVADREQWRLFTPGGSAPHLVFVGGSHTEE